MSGPSKAKMVGCRLFFTVGMTSVCVLSSVYCFHEPDDFDKCEKSNDPNQPWQIDQFSLIVFVILMALNICNAMAHVKLAICIYMV